MGLNKDDMGKVNSLDKARKTACKDAINAQVYARWVDKCPRSDTRTASCQSPRTAYWYALHVDRKPRDDTREAAYKDPEYKRKYEEWENSLK